MNKLEILKLKVKAAFELGQSMINRDAKKPMKKKGLSLNPGNLIGVAIALTIFAGLMVGIVTSVKSVADIPNLSVTETVIAGLFGLVVLAGALVGVMKMFGLKVGGL